jgi:hypothetical protein
VARELRHHGAHPRALLVAVLREVLVDEQLDVAPRGGAHVGGLAPRRRLGPGSATRGSASSTPGGISKGGATPRRAPAKTSLKAASKMARSSRREHMTARRPR